MPPPIRQARGSQGELTHKGNHPQSVVSGTSRLSGVHYLEAMVLSVKCVSMRFCHYFLTSTNKEERTRKVCTGTHLHGALHHPPHKKTAALPCSSDDHVHDLTSRSLSRTRHFKSEEERPRIIFQVYLEKDVDPKESTAGNDGKHGGVFVGHCLRLFTRFLE